MNVLRCLVKITGHVWILLVRSTATVPPWITMGSFATENVSTCFILLLGHCLATPQLVPFSISFTRDRDIAYHVAMQWPNSCMIVLSVTSNLNYIVAYWPDKRCLTHDMRLYQVIMTLHFLNDVVTDFESTRKSIITSKSLIWRVNKEYQVRVFWYRVYQARLRERMLNRSASLAIKQAFDKLYITRHSLSISILSPYIHISISVSRTCANASSKRQCWRIQIS